MNPNPVSFKHVSTDFGPRSMFAPSASNTSALPLDPDMARLPCFATLTPAPATTKAEAVEILKELDASPPVPHVSTSG